LATILNTERIRTKEIKLAQLYAMRAGVFDSMVISTTSCTEAMIMVIRRGSSTLERSTVIVTYIRGKNSVSPRRESMYIDPHVPMSERATVSMEESLYIFFKVAIYATPSIPARMPINRE
jgi:hypothetical protein